MYVKVVLPLNLAGEYLYTNTSGSAKVGSFVKVNFNSKVLPAIVTETLLCIDDVAYKVKEVISVFDICPLGRLYIDFLMWIADYYITKIGLVLKSAIIKEVDLAANLTFVCNTTNKVTKAYQKVASLFSSRKKIAIFELIEQKIKKSTIEKMMEEKFLLPVQKDILKRRAYKKIQQIELSPEQKSIKITHGKFQPYLLDGVTGSGKTAVYLNKIIEILNGDPYAQALIILPEISLTIYILEKIKQFFRNSVEIVQWHSRVSSNKKAIAWHKIVSNDASVIIGARSAIFLPIPNLKIIVVDEEHDTSFKQEQGEFIYSARDIAIMRAKMFDIPVILSSATPSLETIYNTEHKNFTHLKLATRFGGAHMPDISLVDMREVQKVTKYISEELSIKLQENLENGKQSLVFLNKRGYARLILCSGCGYRVKCQNCSTWMAEHKKKNILLCHLCAAQVEKPKQCMACNSQKLISFGPGIEKIEEEIKELFPDKKILTISSDTESTENFQLIEENKIDIVIGTQIVSKGYDFPYLTLLAVIDGDFGIHGGDLRSGEKHFQMLQQAIGRVGRRKSGAGKVILQTYNPDNFLIKALMQNDRDLFYTSELSSRKAEFMPPFSRLVEITISGFIEDEVIFYCKQLAKNIIKNNEVQVFGPAPAPIEFLNNKYRYKFLLICNKNYKVQNYIKNWIHLISFAKKINIQINIDPLSFL